MKYNDSLIEGVFLQTIGTGLSNGNIHVHIKLFLRQLGITDQELIHQMKTAIRFEEERARKRCQPTSKRVLGFSMFKQANHMRVKSQIRS